MNVKVYKLVASTPDIIVDYYLGDATYTGLDVYSFNLPPTSEDYKFYYYVTDTAGNSTYSLLQDYLDGTNALMLRSNVDYFAFFRSNTDLLFKLRT